MVKWQCVLFSILLRRPRGEAIGLDIDLARPRRIAMLDGSPVNRFTLIASVAAGSFWTLPPAVVRFVKANALLEHLGVVGGFVLAAPADLRHSR